MNLLSWMLPNADEAKIQTCRHRMFVGMVRTGRGLLNVPPSFPGPNFLLKFPKLPLLGGTLTQPTFLPNLKHDEILNLLNENLCFWFLARMLVCSALWCFLLPCAEVPAPGRRLDIAPDIVSHAAQPVLKTRHQSL